ncbi:hypothetical protein FE257_009053 [Aspergillus nanangensis]|uniref:Major facilitator superfamily (MFS) profile domain-containing protein n=1 Tax=Aspergillus nanangensis TaxID=2582783 RepID=A0AAD4CWL9_ASPNN|nr:hypothetical protein FE257_009053 [Aspergillus nanangensis]
MDNETSQAVDADVDSHIRSRANTSRHDDRRSATRDSSKDSVQFRTDEHTLLLPQPIEESDESAWDAPIDDDRYNEDSPPRSWRAASVFWLFPFLLLYMLAFGGPVVPKINLMISLICRDYMREKATKDPGFTYLPVVIGLQNPQCQIPEVQSLVSRFQLVFNLIAGIISALVSPRLGRLSDRYGRTRIIVVCAAGTLLAEANILLVAAYPESMSVNIVLISAIVEGIGGSFTTMIALTTSYASDCTSSEKRSVAFGYVYGSIFIGVALGPLIAALLIKRFGTILSVFFGSVCLNTVFLLVVLFIIPESLSKQRQRSAREKHRMKNAHKEHMSWFSWKRWNPLRIVRPLSILFPPIGRPSTLFPQPRGATSVVRRNILLLCGIDTIIFGLAMGASQIVIIYAEYLFGWGNVESSLYISLVCFVRVLNLFVILPAITWLFRKQQREDREIPGSNMLEIVLIRVSIFLDLIGHMGFALSRNSGVMLFSGIVAALGGMGSPILQSSLTKHVPHDRIGQILGAKGLLHSLSRVVAPTACSLIYSLTVAKFPPAVFVCLAAVFVLVLASSFFVKPHASLPDDDTQDVYVEANPSGDEVDDALLRTSS